MEVPKRVEQQLAQYQQLQQQAQVILAQRQQLDLQIRESEHALEELDKLKEGDTIFKSIGSLLIKAQSKEEVAKELKEQKESAEIRVKTLDRQIDRLKERLASLQKDISEQLKRQEQVKAG